MQKFIKYFEDVSLICHDYGKTFQGIQFNGETEAIELFASTSIAMCAQHSLSISTLLKANIITDCFIISRNFIEVYFNLNWTINVETKEEIIKRVFLLEAYPFNNFDKEIKLMERNIDADIPNLNKSLISKYVKAINVWKKKLPYLLEDKNNLQSNFKQLKTSFADRMGKERLKNYHNYRFNSIFIHPTPLLKEFFMNRISNQNRTTDTIIDSLKQSLSYCLALVAGCFEITNDILYNFHPEHNTDRKGMHNKLYAIFQESNEGYFGNSTNK